MTYPNLFKSRYASLTGRDWLKRVEPDDLKAFVDIGLQETDHGRRGGIALRDKYGIEYLKALASKGGKAKRGRS